MYYYKNDKDERLNHIKWILEKNGYTNQFIEDNIFYYDYPNSTDSMPGIYLARENVVLSSTQNCVFSIEEYQKGVGKRKGQRFSCFLKDYINKIYPDLDNIKLKSPFIKI